MMNRNLKILVFACVVMSIVSLLPNTVFGIENPDFKIELRELKDTVIFSKPVSLDDPIKCSLENGLREWAEESSENRAKLEETLRIFGTGKHLRYVLSPPRPEKGADYTSIMILSNEWNIGDNIQKFYKSISAGKPMTLEEAKSVDEDEVSYVIRYLLSSTDAYDNMEPEYGFVNDKISYWYYIQRNTATTIAMISQEVGIHKGDSMLSLNMDDFEVYKGNVVNETSAEFQTRLLKALTIVHHDGKLGEYVYVPEREAN